MPFVCDFYNSTLLEKAFTKLLRKDLSKMLREIIKLFLLVKLSFLKKGFNATSYEI